MKILKKTLLLFCIIFTIGTILSSSLQLAMGTLEDTNIHIVGKRLESYGFRYEKTESVTHIFVRELHGIQRYYDPE